MIVGVVSDTHLSPLKQMSDAATFEELCSDDKLRNFYDIIEPHFRGVDAVIHSGDIIDLSVVALLRYFGEVYTVAGNMDPGPVRKSLPVKRIVKLGSFSIGIIHGSGAPDGLSYKVRQKFTGDRVDCIVFGHSHQPYGRVEDGILMFNPGSALDGRSAADRTIGILHLEDRIWGEHIYLERN
jgi:hypothetical protein